ncbi:MAG: TlpA family protein disulfide reductase [Candidatus Dormibacteria bacterium]
MSTPQRPEGILGVTRRPTRREWRGAITLFGVGVVGLVAALLFVHPQASLLPLGSPAPAFTLQSADGATLSPATASGASPYILEFFEASCAHCQEAASQLCHEKVPVYAIDAARETASTVSTFHQRYAPSCTYPLLLDPQLSVSGKFSVTAVPTVYVVSRGRIAYAGAGLGGVAGLDGAVARALGG